MKKKKKIERSIIIRAFILLIIIAGGIFLYYYVDYSRYLTKDRISLAIESIRRYVAGYGVFGPIIFIVSAIFAIIINIPTVVMIYFSVLIFGGFAGALIAVISINIAITMIYFIAQKLGRDFVVWVFGDRLKKLENRMNKKGMITVVYIRLLVFMSPPLNWLISLTNINYRDIFLGTLIGSAPNIIIYTWLSNMIIEIITAGQSLNPIKTPRLLIPLCIIGVIFITVRIIDYSINKKRRITDDNATAEEE